MHACQGAYAGKKMPMAQRAVYLLAPNNLLLNCNFSWNLCLLIWGPVRGPLLFSWDQMMLEAPNEIRKQNQKSMEKVPWPLLVIQQPDTQQWGRRCEGGQEVWTCAQVQLGQWRAAEWPWESHVTSLSCLCFSISLKCRNRSGKEYFSIRAVKLSTRKVF